MTKNNEERTRGLNLRDIPGLETMVKAPRWCLWYWRVLIRKDGTKARTKMPVIPGTGIGVRVNDLEGVVGYDVASAAVPAEGAAGVGWRMKDDFGRVAIDIDHCRDPKTGRVDGWALAILTAAPGAYREITPSGTGLRVIGRLGGLPEAFQGRLRVKAWVDGLGPDSAEERAWWGKGIQAGAAIEIFHACSRFLTVTGWDGTGDCTVAIDEIVGWLMERADERKTNAASSAERADDGGLSLVGHIEDVVAALEILPNDDLHWDDWMTIGLATVNASGGSEEGWAAFEKWSAKSGRHEEDDCRKYWEQWKRSPGNRIGIGKLMIEAEKADPAWIRPSRRPFGGSGGGVARRRIKIIAGELHHLASEGEAAIIASGLPVFQRAMLVRPAIMEMDAADGGKTQVTGLHRLDMPGILDLFCQTGEWTRFDKGLKKDVKATPPEIVAKVLLSRAGEWNVPYLRGIIAHPTIRHDGSLLDRSGYDPASGYYLALPSGLNMPSISEKPSKGECVAAMEELEGLLVEFPFIDDGGASRSVALSLLITAVVRAAMDVAPIHGATAPIRGSGKSFLYDIAAAIVYGGRCPVIYAGNSSDELEKKLNGLLLQGATLFSIDNLNIPLEGDLICQIATQSVLGLRRLGRSDMYQTPNSALAGVTGNNLVIMEDVTRRVVLASMDAKVERPEYRRFTANPFRTVLKDRGRYIAAILTIVRGYLTAGEKSAPDALASFDDYTRFVRGPLVWLGMADPAATMDKLHEADPVLVSLRSVMAAWEAAIGLDRPVTAAGAIEAAQSQEFEDTPANETETAKKAREGRDKARRDAKHALGLALSGISRNGMKATPKELGIWLARHANGIAGGKCFKGKVDSHSKTTLWTLVGVDKG
jgi:hypothetical protein